MMLLHFSRPDLKKLARSGLKKGDERRVFTDSHGLRWLPTFEAAERLEMESSDFITLARRWPELGGNAIPSRREKLFLHSHRRGPRVMVWNERVVELVLARRKGWPDPKIRGEGRPGLAEKQIKQICEDVRHAKRTVLSIDEGLKENKQTSAKILINTEQANAAVQCLPAIARNSQETVQILSKHPTSIGSPTAGLITKPMPWRVIGEHIGCTDRTARRRLAGAIISDRGDRPVLDLSKVKPQWRNALSFLLPDHGDPQTVKRGQTRTTATT
jgi:hypothetical protein